MHVKAQQISDLLGGRIEGNPDTLITHPAKIEEASEGAISFLANPKYESYAYTTQASVLLVSEEFKPSEEIKATMIRVKNVYHSLSTLMNHFGNQKEALPEVDPSLVYIDKEAQIAENSYVGPFSSICKGASIGNECTLYSNVYVGENVRIGNNVKIYPGVRIYKDSVIGDRCVIHANTVIGSDGFGFARNDDQSFKKIAQLGNVILEEDVDIGANVVIDRASMGSTIIRKGAKLDNLIQVAHNVEIGEHTALAAMVGVAGSTKIGKGVLVGGQAGFAGHQEIADGVQIQAQSGVTGNHLTPNAKLYGTPAIDYATYIKAYAHFKKLPDMAKKLRDLTKAIDELKNKEQ